MKLRPRCPVHNCDVNWWESAVEELNPNYDPTEMVTYSSEGFERMKIIDYTLDLSDWTCDYVNTRDENSENLTDEEADELYSCSEHWVVDVTGPLTAGTVPTIDYSSPKSIMKATLGWEDQ